MIQITKGEPLIANPGLVVLSDTGYYNDGDPVLCASVITPNEPACSFEAKFVRYGGMVYSISNPEELLAEIVRMDPASLFGKNADMLAQEKMIREIELENTEKNEDNIPTRAAKPKAKKVKSGRATQVSNAMSTTMSTTTPEVIGSGSGSGAGAGAGAGVGAVENETLTNTPNIIFDIDPSAGGSSLVE